MAASLGPTFVRILDDYDHERAMHPNPAGSALPAFIRRDARDSVVAVEQAVGWTHPVTGSAGLGNWAETPWVAVFDEDITTSAQRGFYIVYLFRRDGAAVYLTLNQGTTEAIEDFGRHYLIRLRQRATEAAAALKVDGALGPKHVVGPVKLVGNGSLTRGYQAGTIVSVAYPRTALPGNEPTLRSDLEEMLVVYRRLVDLRAAAGQLGTEAEEIPEGVESGKYRWHRAAERKRSLAEKVKKYRGYDCEVCGVNFRRRYPSVGKDFIEAHHLTPIATLAGRPTNVTANDFVVVCPNCHRMLHASNPPTPPATLKAALGPA